MRSFEAVVVAEGGGWSAFLPGLPISGDGDTFDDAISELVLPLREYAEGWNDHLPTAPNHRKNGELVQLVGLSSDEQLRKWVLGQSRGPASYAPAPTASQRRETGQAQTAT